MDFELTQEQQMWKQAVHDFVSKEVKPKAQEVDEEAKVQLGSRPQNGAAGDAGHEHPRGIWRRRR
jgi:alkylation response protein AidB-like acyl-CoA dehydrogenase